MNDTIEPTLRTEEMTLNMGPQHPSTHGGLRFVIRADGEVMREAVPATIRLVDQLETNAAGKIRRA